MLKSLEQAFLAYLWIVGLGIIFSYPWWLRISLKKVCSSHLCDMKVTWTVCTARFTDESYRYNPLFAVRLSLSFPPNMSGLLIPDLSRFSIPTDSWHSTSTRNVSHQSLTVNIDSSTMCRNSQWALPLAEIKTSNTLRHLIDHSAHDVLHAIFLSQAQAHRRKTYTELSVSIRCTYPTGALFAISLTSEDPCSDSSLLYQYSV